MTILGWYLSCSAFSLTEFAIKRRTFFFKGMKVPIITITIHFELFNDWQMDLIDPHTPKGEKNHYSPPPEFKENEQVSEASVARWESKRAAEGL